MASTHIEIESNGKFSLHLSVIIARICYLYMSISNLYNQSFATIQLAVNHHILREVFNI